MASETETLLSQRLQALRVDPPDAVGFSLSLRARLEVEVAGSRAVVQLSNRRVSPKRVVSRRVGVLLSVAAIFVGGSAFALVGPRILEWVGLKEPEVRLPMGNDLIEKDKSETLNNRTRESRAAAHPIVVPELQTLTSTQPSASPTAQASIDVLHNARVKKPPKVGAAKPATPIGQAKVDVPEITQPALEVPSAERVHVPKLSIDIANSPPSGVLAQPLPELSPIEVPRLDPERPRVVNPDTNQLRDNSVRETLRRNRAGKSD